MPTTYVDYTATAAQTDFAFTFPYLEDEHVVVEIDGVQKTLTTDYTIVTSPSTKIVLTSGATAGQVVRVRRKSQPGTDLVDFENGSVLTESELDRAYLHNRYLNEEIGELNDASLQKEAGGTDWDAGGSKIKNVGAPTLTADATTKQYVDDKVNQLSNGASSPPTKWVFTGTAGANTTYSVTGAEVNGDTAYDVSVDGSVLEPTTDYTVNPDTDTLTIVSTLSGGEDIVVIERGFGVAITGTIGADQLQTNSVSTAKIQNDAVDGTKIADDSIDSEHYVDESIDTAHLADHSVIAVKISNTDSKFNVQTDGKVGIGTTSPDRPLHIFSSTTDSVALRLTNQSDTSYYADYANGFIKAYGSSTSFKIILNDDEKIRIKDNGNVGIGTDNPSYKLDVQGNTTSSANSSVANLHASADGAEAVLLVKNDSATGEGARIALFNSNTSSYPNANKAAFVLESATPALCVCFNTDAGATQATFKFLSDSNAFFIANTASVPSTPTGGGVMYVEGGALKYKGSSGTITTLGTP